MQVTAVIPSDRASAVLIFVVSLIMLVGAFGLLGSRKIAAIVLAAVACGAFIAGMKSWSDHTEISLSRTQNSLTIQRNGLTGSDVQTYPLKNVSSAVVDVGADATKRIDFVLASGTTVEVGNYEQREGFEAAVVAFNALLGVPTPAPVGPQQ